MYRNLFQAPVNELKKDGLILSRAEYTRGYYLNSKDRVEGSVSNFQLRASKLNNISHLAIENTQIINSIYNVNATNKTISFEFATGGIQTITLTEGAYTITSFMTELNSKLAAIVTPSTITATYNSTNQKITIASGSGNFTIYDTSLSYGIGVYPGMKSILGFDLLKSGAASYTSDYIVNLSPTSYLDICSKRLTQFEYNSETSDLRRGDLLIRVPTNSVNFGDTLFFTNYVFKSLPFNNSEELGIIDIQVYDEFGGYALLNGMNFSMKINLYK